MPDTSTTTSARSQPGQVHGVTPVELLWDLVFVFAVTQVSTLLSRNLSWSGAPKHSARCAASGRERHRRLGRRDMKAEALLEVQPHRVSVV